MYLSKSQTYSTLQFIVTIQECLWILIWNDDLPLPPPTRPPTGPQIHAHCGLCNFMNSHIVLTVWTYGMPIPQF